MRKVFRWTCCIGTVLSTAIFSAQVLGSDRKPPSTPVFSVPVSVANLPVVAEGLEKAGIQHVVVNLPEAAMPEIEKALDQIEARGPHPGVAQAFHKAIAAVNYHDVVVLLALVGKKLSHEEYETLITLAEEKLASIKKFYKEVMQFEGNPSEWKVPTFCKAVSQLYQIEASEVDCDALESSKLWFRPKVQATMESAKRQTSMEVFIRARHLRGVDPTFSDGRIDIQRADSVVGALKKSRNALFPALPDTAKR